jgi:hypothetical protein
LLNYDLNRYFNKINKTKTTLGYETKSGSTDLESPVNVIKKEEKVEYYF